MAFTLYNNPIKSTDVSSSPVHQNMGFTLTETVDANNSNPRILSGISSEPPAIKYSTSWGNGPTTTFADKVKEFTNNDLIKTFASMNKDYKPVIATDAWTQQYPLEACRINTSLKFRSYPINMYNTSSYFYLLDSLFKLTTPKKFSFTDNLDNMELSLTSAGNLGFSFGKSIKHINDSIKNLINVSKTNENIKWSNIIDNILTYVDKNKKVKYSDIQITAQNLGDNEKDLRTLIYELNLIIKNLDIFTEADGCGISRFKLKYGNIFKDTYENWLISDWNFKPSIQTTKIKYNDNNYIRCPIYIDFNISLETAELVGTNEFNKIFI